MPSTTYATLGDALSDPSSSIARFVLMAQRAMSHNPQTEAEWTQYLAWQRERSEQGNREFSTQAWRESLREVI